MKVYHEKNLVSRASSKHISEADYLKKNGNEKSRNLYPTLYRDKRSSSVATVYRVSADKEGVGAVDVANVGGAVNMGANVGVFPDSHGHLRFTEELHRAKSDGVLFDQSDSADFQGRLPWFLIVYRTYRYAIHQVSSR